MPHRRTITWKKDSDGRRKLDRQGHPIPDTWRYYFEHDVPERGRVVRSLGTSHRRTAESRENRLLDLIEQGRADLVRAWLEGKVTLKQLQLATTDEKLGALTRELREAHRLEVSLKDASEKALKVKRGEVRRETTIESYRRVHRDFAAWAAREKEIEKKREEEAAKRKAEEAEEGERPAAQDREAAEEAPAAEEEVAAAASRAPERDHAEGGGRRKAPWDTDAYQKTGLKLPARQWITSDRVKEYLGARRLLGRSDRTVHNDKTALSMLGTYCYEKGWIEKPLDLKWQAHKVRIHWLTREQARDYLAEAEPGEERTFFGTLIGTGMRAGELLPRTAGEFLFEEAGGHGVHCRVRLGKTEDATRSLFVPTWAARLLRALIEARGLGPGDLLFTTKLRDFEYRHHEICARLGIRPREGPAGPAGQEVEGNPNYTIHDHRHTAAVHLARAGMPLNQLQRQLGHSTIEQTMRYAAFHPDYTDVAPYFDRVAERLGLDDLGEAAGGGEAREGAGDGA